MTNKLLGNIGKLHTTELGAERIQNNLMIRTEDIVGWCREKILSANALYVRKGKNWYVSVDDIIIAVNATSLTIITAHRQN